MFYSIYTYSPDKKVAISELNRVDENNSFIEQVAVIERPIDNYYNYRDWNEHVKMIEFEDNEDALLWFRLNYGG